MVQVSKLIPYVNNAKVHSDEQITKIASSIKEFQFCNPILTDGDNGIIAGHGRLEAAKKLGMDEVPVVELAHLSESQKKALILADNRLSEIGVEWDMDMVRLELEALSMDDFDIDLTGFDLDFGINEDVEPKDTEVDMDDMNGEMFIKLKYSFDEYQEITKKISTLEDSAEDIFKRVILGS